MKTVLPNACLRRGFGRQADLVIEGYVDPPSLCYGAASPLGEPKHREGFFGAHTGYYTLPEPYPAYARPKLRRGEGPSSIPPWWDHHAPPTGICELVAHGTMR